MNESLAQFIREHMSIKYIHFDARKVNEDIFVYASEFHVSERLLSVFQLSPMEQADFLQLGAQLEYINEALRGVEAMFERDVFRTARSI